MTIRPALILSLLLFACVGAAAQSLPEVERGIVPVASWGGTPADASRAQRQTITHITLHHQGEPFRPGTDPRQYLRNLQNWSRRTKHWLDIPYHYIIDLDGRIYEGRKIDYAGDTNTEYDPTGHALIEVVGNFEEVEPNQQQLDAVVNLMALLAHKYQVPLDHIASHRDFSKQTVCPGANLYRYVQDGYFRHKVALKLAQAASAPGG
ncbi:N-acetylmuramoyl-L-alanine amidase [Massilia sp. WF1]|uniref:peptidoglycan recognition protein family protein n=1 Tax=unclassified Massilia TaxID=2609279 RepID=UPI00068AB93D|nr:MULTISPECIES: peptidoglycan recognition family protein [unclassified Massilia]ALK95127.1 N-acetylmuramoyl-L-alanine amidase [Massilia sp. WG5]KNZ67545.1 N-acetylmuramoyl-L-alanine amidase [Massilia sp. WF1]